MGSRPKLTLALFSSIVLGLSLLGCATGKDSPARSPDDAAIVVESEPRDSVSERDPTLALVNLEDRLIGAQRVEFEFEIESEGALISHFRGRVRWLRDAELSLVASGDFAGQAQALELRADATTMTSFVEGSERWSGARPPALIEALVLGLTHMGLLHNLALLTGGMGPDHAEGGAREWLATDERELGPAQTRAGVLARPLAFVIVVSHEPVGRATLWLDERGLPIEREQVVHFPEGDMRVVERYSNFVLE